VIHPSGDATSRAGRLSAHDGRTFARASLSPARSPTLRFHKKNNNTWHLGERKSKMRSGIRRLEHRARAAGVTLIELMVVVAISAILLAVGVPMMHTFVDRNRVATQVNEMIADIALTRSEAIARRGRVIMCRSSNPTSTTAQCDGAATDWNSGWIVFVDNTSPTDADPFQRDTSSGTDEPVVRAFTRTATQVSITANSAFAGLTVTPDGTVWLLNGDPLGSLAQPLRLDFAGSENENRRSLCIGNGGVARTSNTYQSCT
jgi:type IV fimbrial biogenesis protein FimT